MPRLTAALVRLGSAALVLLVGVFGMGLTANHWVCNRAAAHWVEVMPGAVASGTGLKLEAHAHQADLDCAVGCCTAWRESQKLTEAAAASQASWTAFALPMALVPAPAALDLAAVPRLLHGQPYRPPPLHVCGSQRRAQLQQYRI